MADTLSDKELYNRLRETVIRKYQEANLELKHNPNLKNSSFQGWTQATEKLKSHKAVAVIVPSTYNFRMFVPKKFTTPEIAKMGTLNKKQETVIPLDSVEKFEEVFEIVKRNIETVIY